LLRGVITLSPNIRKGKNEHVSLFCRNYNLYINLTLPKSCVFHSSSFIIGPNTSKFGMQTRLEVSHAFRKCLIDPRVSISYNFQPLPNLSIDFFSLCCFTFKARVSHSKLCTVVRLLVYAQSMTSKLLLGKKNISDHAFQAAAAAAAALFCTGIQELLKVKMNIFISL
jgi:hypothetical protein